MKNEQGPVEGGRMAREPWDGGTVKKASAIYTEGGGDLARDARMHGPSGCNAC